MKYVVDDMIKNEIRDLKNLERMESYTLLWICMTKPDFFETDSYDRLSC